MGKVIFLNGCGSSGKSTLAKGIQQQSKDPWLHVSMDQFIDILPERYWGVGDMASKGYFKFIPGENCHGPTMSVQKGEKGNQVFSLLPKIADLFLQEGNNVIIDEVLLDDKSLEGYIEALAPHVVYFVGVFCSLSTMQKREIQRGDRLLGLSNDQVDRVHAGLREYDLTIDTTSLLPEMGVDSILKFMECHPYPKGFINMKNKL